MYTVWHVDKYKVTFKLVISSKRISRDPTVEKQCSRVQLSIKAATYEETQLGFLSCATTNENYRPKTTITNVKKKMLFNDFLFI